MEASGSTGEKKRGDLTLPPSPCSSSRHSLSSTDCNVEASESIGERVVRSGGERGETIGRCANTRESGDSEVAQGFAVDATGEARVASSGDSDLVRRRTAREPNSNELGFARKASNIVLRLMLPRSCAGVACFLS